MTSEINSAEDFARHFDVSRETLARLMTYQALLGKWQKSINLVGPATLDSFWARHAADSAQIIQYAPESPETQAQTWLDLGSGAGFPALIIAIMVAETDPEARVHMIESDRKKVNFLRTVLADTGIAAGVHHGRIEALAADKPAALAHVDIITARALAPLPDLLGLMQPFCNPSTIALLHKGRNWQEELTASQQYWKLVARAEMSQTDAAARILRLSHMQAQ